MELIIHVSVPEGYIGDEKMVEREACRAVVFDEHNLIPVLFVSKELYHKLPGWGIDPGEDKITTLTRELLEESWCEAEITKEIGMTIESNSSWKQTSYCYLGKVAKKSAHNFTDKEKEKGFELKRVTIDEAIALLQSDTPQGETGKRIQKRDLAILKKTKEIM